MRLNKFESERLITFIPPDGEFDLMSYRVDTHVKPLIWVEAIVENFNKSMDIMIRLRGMHSIEVAYLHNRIGNVYLS